MKKNYKKMNNEQLTKKDLQDALAPFATKQDLKDFATKEFVVKTVEDSADDVMRSCQVQFISMDKRFDRIETKLDTMDTKLDHLIVFMKGHEKRITRIERQLELA